MSKQNRTLKCSVLVCGVPCGKTSLIRRFVDDSFNDEYDPTSKCIKTTKTIEIDNATVEFSIFDCSADSIINGASTNVMLGKDGFIVVYDITNYESFAYTKSFFDAIRHYANRRTLPVLVGNKRDLGLDRATSELVAEDFAKELGISYIETSAKDGENVNKLFHEVLNNIVKPDEEVANRKWMPIIQSNGCTKCTCLIT